ncbi:MAG: tRNA (adenosine(37)-N6)-dimethylallyltransferase MiaA [Flaviflexus sp.]|nr:tRNA (adenosine(37)-N6)-dimethylallyltransferase MiaA [Flaviflexus sp.]
MSIIALVGPTAVGKTSASIELAEALGGPHAVEIIGADAMQLYRGMDIGTAKATVAERRGIAHHQIDVLDPTETASVAAYQRHARADLAAIQGRGRLPIIVGGSGLYVSALLDEIDFPGTDPRIRARYEEILAERGPSALHAMLGEVDPASAAVIAPENSRRVVRALEVNELTGRSFQPRFPRHTPHYEGITLIGLRMGKEELDDRIARRTEAMFEAGLLDEVTKLRERGIGRTAAGATGYREAGQVLDGELTVAEAKDEITRATRKLVRKQLTWFRRDRRIRWIEAPTSTSELVALARLES